MQQDIWASEVRALLLEQPATHANRLAHADSMREPSVGYDRQLSNATGMV